MLVVFFCIFIAFFIIGMTAYVIWSKIARMIDGEDKKHDREEDINDAYHDLYKQELKRKYKEEEK